MTDHERTDTLPMPQAWWSGGVSDTGRIDLAAVPT